MVICQAPESRQKAVQFCDEIVRRFWDSYDISVSWFTQDDVEDPAHSGHLEEAAHRARLVIFEACNKPIPPAVLDRLAHFLCGRKSGQAQLAGLAETNVHNQILLRNLAHRVGMDFISEVPPDLNATMPDSPESCTSRAEAVSHLLSDILRKPPTPPPPLT